MKMNLTLNTLVSDVATFDNNGGDMGYATVAISLQRIEWEELGRPLRITANIEVAENDR